jgi:2-polyprenyl-3-methyl-5-hydroxy-6-metoxy-1,4-benzoquinol methylase
MGIGPAIRRMLPDRLERMAADAYRRIFVDLDKVAAALCGALPVDARVLDIGGGDGELLNRIYRRRPDLRFTMVDIAPSVGRYVAPEFRAATTFHPATRIEDHVGTLRARYDATIVCDVLHHVPADMRVDFLRALSGAVSNDAPMLVKDIEPGHPVAALSYLSDVYISGDRNVKLVSRAALHALANQALSAPRIEELPLLAIDPPNYLVRIQA